MSTTPFTAAPASRVRHRTWFAVLALSILMLLTACGGGSDTEHAAAHHSGDADMHDGSGMTATPGMADHGTDHHDTAMGLLGSEGGYTLKPSVTALTVGEQTLRFQILDPNGMPQTDYVEEQTQRLHFYLVRLDLTGYQHLHPVLSHGTWSVEITVAAPGRYRMYTDFVARDGAGGEHPLVLSTQLTAPGDYRPAALPAASRTVTVDGLTATMTGTLTVGASNHVSFRITQAGQPVRDLQPYLGAFAHLTALHAGDAAYQHLHPATAASAAHGGPDLGFTVDLPESGNWRLFLQVQRFGQLHLLPITVAVTR